MLILKYICKHIWAYKLFDTRMFLCDRSNIPDFNSFFGRWSGACHRVWTALHIVFELICILTTLALVIWCSYEFTKDEDICEVSFKTFLEDEYSTYPDLWFMLPTRFNETALRTYDKHFTKHKYRSHLFGGRSWDEKMLDIDFEKVSMQINDYLLQTCLYETLRQKIKGICKNNVTLTQQNSFGQTIVTLHFPSDRPVYSAIIKLKNSAFLD